MRWFEKIIPFIFVFPLPVWAEKAASSELVQSISPVNATQILKIGGSFVLVLMLVFLLSFIAKRISTFSPRKSLSMRILTGLSIGLREKIVLLQVGESHLLVGVAPGQIRTLHIFSDNPLEKTELNETVKNSDFKGYLKNLVKKESLSE